MDVDKDDLVLHEGDGKIRRPSKLKIDGKGGSKIKKMPSPRRVMPAPTTAEGAAKMPQAGPSTPKNASTSSNRTNKTKRPENREHAEKPDSVDGDSVDDESIFEDWDDDDRRGRIFDSIAAEYNSQSKESQKEFGLTSEDLEICRRLDDEYERALEERDIGYNARYYSVRQTAITSIVFMAIYMVQGTFVYRELLLLNHQNHERNFVSELFEGEEGEDTEFDNEFSNWSISESLFFSIFTITTVGYGREDLPTTPSFQAYTIAYIMVGIATITIMVAQVYQCIALEASRARLSQDKQDELRRRSGLMIKGPKHRPIAVSSPSGSSTNSRDEIIISRHTNTGLVPRCFECIFRIWDRAKFFFRETEIGKGISVIFPFAGLILSGALAVCLLEGWTFLESLYFSVVSLTTVGFGDYVPTKLPTIWFCICWLPFSIGFMSLYLSNVATFYIRLSDRNIRRIERNLRRRLQKAKEKAEEERAEILRRAYKGQELEIEIAAGGPELESDDNLQEHRSDASTDTLDDFKQATIPKNHARSVMKRKKQEGFNMLQTTDESFHSEDDDILVAVATTSSENTKLSELGRDNGHRRRQKIIENCRVLPSSSEHSGDRIEDALDTSHDISNDRTMKSMKDVILAVHNTLDKNNDATNHHTSNAGKFMSIKSTQNMIDYSIFRRQNQSKKPSFALRVLVQERMAEIIAIEVAGFHSAIEIKDYKMSVKIESMSDTADKWSIPRRARKAFRAVAFEVLYFVGEHGLITRGADALYELTPFEFHGLFSTLVAAMGDADMMEGWLAKSDALAQVDLQQGVLHRSAPPEDVGRGGLRKRVFSID